MRRLSFIFAGAALLIATGAHSQSSSTPGNGQAQSPAPRATPAAEASTPVAPAAKKVRTNDDVGDLRADSTISTVGSTAGSAGTKSSGKTAQTGKPRNQKQFETQIARLEGQIPALDKQIAELQDAIDGKPTGDAKSSRRPRSVQADDWNLQMQDLQKKKQDILDHVAELKDEARHQGVAPNTLP